VPENQHTHQFRSPDVLLWDGFRLDRHCLYRINEANVASPVALGSRALDLLRLLVERHGELIPKAEIMATVWPGTAVEENNLTVQISTLRRVLDDGRAAGNCIQTVAGRGYLFTAAVMRLDPAPASEAAPLSGNGNAELIDATNGQPNTFAGPASSPALPGVTSRARPRLWIGIIAAGFVAVGLVALLIVAGNWGWLGQASPAPRLSIVVLPFTNLSDDPKQQYFADGITEDLTTDLSRITDSFVISRNTAFTYKDKPANAKQIGRELGVRYVLEGSVQRSGNLVRVNAQLIDAETDSHLWADGFERGIGDLLTLQNEITRRIGIALNLELIGAEAAHPPDHPDALDYIFHARATQLKPQSRDVYAERIGLYERALAVDPASVEAQSGLAAELSNRVMEGMSDSRAVDTERAEKLARRALAASPRNPLAYYAKGQVLRAQGRYEEAIPEYETAIAFNRNWVVAISALAYCKLHAGPIAEVIPLLEEILRLSPRDPMITNIYQRIGVAYALQSRTDEAIMWLERARDANPLRAGPHTFLASAYALKGETERAAAELAEARSLTRDDRLSSMARLRAIGIQWGPKIRPLVEATYYAGLRKAGMPEE
jgi:adenylate cyclase